MSNALKYIVGVLCVCVGGGGVLGSFHMVLCGVVTGGIVLYMYIEYHI